MSIAEKTAAEREIRATSPQRPTLATAMAAADKAERQSDDGYVRAAAAMAAVLLTMRQGGRHVPTATDMRAQDVIRKTLERVRELASGEAPDGFASGDNAFASPSDAGLTAVAQALEAGE